MLRGWVTSKKLWLEWCAHTSKSVRPRLRAWNWPKLFLSTQGFLYSLGEDNPRETWSRFGPRLDHDANARHDSLHTQPPTQDESQLSLRVRQHDHQFLARQNFFAVCMLACLPQLARDKPHPQILVLHSIQAAALERMLRFRPSSSKHPLSRVLSYATVRFDQSTVTLACRKQG